MPSNATKYEPMRAYQGYIVEGRPWPDVSREVYPGRDPKFTVGARRFLDKTYKNPSKDGRPLEMSNPQPPPTWVQAETSQFFIPASPHAPADDYPELSGDYAVISDFHIPFHSKACLDAFLEASRRVGLTKCVVVGDTFDNGMFHKRAQGQHSSYQWEKCVPLADQIFAAFAGVFREIVILSGNHDDWLYQKMGDHASPEFFMARLFSRYDGVLRWTRHSTAFITSGGHRLAVTHGANFSGANPLGPVRALASKWGCGVLMGHQHLLAEGRDVSGRYQCIALGGAFSAPHLDYLHHAPRTQPMVVNGFALVKDGWAKLYQPTPNGWQ